MMISRFCLIVCNVLVLAACSARPEWAPEGAPAVSACKPVYNGLCSKTTAPWFAQLDRVRLRIDEDVTARAGQRHQKWIETLHTCNDKQTPAECVAEKTKRRISYLEVQNHLIKQRASATYQCYATKLKAHYYDTPIPAATVYVFNTTEIFFLNPAGSGSRYGEDNNILWDKGDTAIIAVDGWLGRQECERVDI